MFELDIIRLQELASCGNVVKQVPHGEVRTSRRRNFLCVNMLRISEIHLTADFILFPAGLEGNLSYSRDRSQRFSTETEGQYPVQVLSGRQFGCRMPLKAQNRLVR